MGLFHDCFIVAMEAMDHKEFDRIYWGIGFQMWLQIWRNGCIYTWIKPGVNSIIDNTLNYFMAC